MGTLPYIKLFYLFSIISPLLINSQNIPWQEVPSPSTSITGIFNSCDGLLATTMHGVFFSDDLGDNWELIDEFNYSVAAVNENNVLFKSGMVTEQNPSCTYFNEYYHAFNCVTKTITQIMSFSGQSCWHGCWNPSHAIGWGQENFAIKRPYGCIYAGTISCDVWESSNSGLSFSTAYNCEKYPPQIDTTFFVYNDSLFMRLPDSLPADYIFVNDAPFQSSTSSTKVNSFAFFRGEGESNLIYSTPDLGASWTIDTLSAIHYNSVFSVGEYLFIKNPNSLYVSHKLDYPLFSPIYETQFTNVHYLIANDTWIYSFPSGQTFRSSDQGANWEQAAMNGFPSINIRKGHSNLTATFFQTNGDIWYTQLDTFEFLWMNEGFTNNHPAYSFTDQQTQYTFTSTTGGYLNFIRSTDLGNTWDTIGYSTVGVPKKHFIENNTISIVIEKEYGNLKILYSEDAGETWQWSPTMYLEIEGFTIKSGNWYRAFDNKIESSSDKGINWEAVFNGHSICKIDSSIYALKSDFLTFQVFKLDSGNWTPYSPEFEWDAQEHKSYTKDGYFVVQSFNHEKILIVDVNKKSWKELPMFADYEYLLNTNPWITTDLYGAIGYHIFESDLYMITDDEGLWKTNLCELFSPSANINIELCRDEIFIYNGSQIDTAGEYIFTFPINSNCDSIVQLNVSYKSDTTNVTVHFCEGESVFYNGIEISSTDTLIFEYTNSNGCDSLVILNAVKNDAPTIVFNESICENSSYLFEGTNITQAGTYEHIYITNNSCDSTIILNLETQAVILFEIDTAMASGENYLGTPIFSDTTFIENLMAENGCDSTVTTHISILTNTADIFSKKPELKIYPNPANEVAHIFLENMEDPVEAISVFDSNGKKVFHSHFTEKKYGDIFSQKINTADWPGGVYAVVVVYESGVLSGRLVR